MMSLRAVRDAVEAWLRANDFNVAPDLVPLQGWMSAFTCTYHQSWGGASDVGLVQASFTVRIYVSQADMADAQRKADDAQTALGGALEGCIGPWHDLTVANSSVTEEANGDARYLVVVLNAAVYV